MHEMMDNYGGNQGGDDDYAKGGRREGEERSEQRRSGKLCEVKEKTRGEGGKEAIFRDEGKVHEDTEGESEERREDRRERRN